MSVEAITEIRQYLTFKLDNEVFALDVATVREVLDFTTVTRIPRTPEFMRGVINLRGSVVPVVDLRLAFGMSATEKTVNTCIIVMEVRSGGRNHHHRRAGGLGGRGDRPGTGSDRAGAAASAPPSSTDFIRGMGKRDSRFLMILDIDRVFSADQLVEMRTTTPKAS